MTIRRQRQPQQFATVTANRLEKIAIFHAVADVLPLDDALRVIEQEGIFWTRA
jgi:hypothetical protein